MRSIRLVDGEVAPDNRETYRAEGSLLCGMAQVGMRDSASLPGSKEALVPLNNAVTAQKTPQSSSCYTYREFSFSLTQYK